MGVERDLPGRRQQLDEDAGRRRPSGRRTPSPTIASGKASMSSASAVDRPDAGTSTVLRPCGRPSGSALPASVHEPTQSSDHQSSGRSGRPRKRAGERAALVEPVERVVGEPERAPDRVEPAPAARPSPTGGPREPEVDPRRPGRRTVDRRGAVERPDLEVVAAGSRPARSTGARRARGRPSVRRRGSCSARGPSRRCPRPSSARPCGAAAGPAGRPGRRRARGAG